MPVPLGVSEAKGSVCLKQSRCSRHGDEADDSGPKLMKRKNKVDGASLNGGLQHLEGQRRTLILHQDASPSVLDCSRPEGTISPPAGQHNTDGCVAIDLRNRFEQDVRRGAGEVHSWGARQHDRTVLADEEMVVRGAT